VIIQCQNDQINEKNNSQMTLLFTDLSSGKVLQIDIHLCWSLLRRVTIGHCHKALFGNVPFYLIQQWLDYHLLIGVEQFYMYDRTLKYKNLLRPYIKRGEVIYVPFPLAKQVIGRERFNWIDQFVGKMHCLMRVRSSFEWLGTWDIDEYLNFHSNQQQIFLSNCKNGRNKCHSMLNEYLKKHFNQYDNIIIHSINFLGKRNVISKNSNSTPPLITKLFQYRLATWNDRDKYLTRPIHTNMINIHYGLLIPGKAYYKNPLTSPLRNASNDSRQLIHLNHYPSAKDNRDKNFLAFHKGDRQYVHDPVLWEVNNKLQKKNEKKKQKSMKKTEIKF